MQISIPLIVTLVTLALYLASLVVLVMQITARNPSVAPLFRILFGCSVISHIAFLNFHVFPNQQLHVDFFRVSSLIFCVISLFAFLAILRKLPIENLLVILFPLTMIGISVGEWVETPSPKVITDKGVMTHILLSIICYSLITLASVQAVALAAQDYLLKRHTFGGIFRYLPPLQTMEKLLFEMTWIGFVLLTLSIVSGFLFLENMFAQHLVHKTLFSILAWIIFAILLYGRHTRGWRGISAAVWTIVGFVLLMLGYFGSKLVLELILHKG
jgi:ABC-type uncharacterized transport system permease subunit